MSFDSQQLVENIQAFMDHIVGMKPVAVKGTYLKSVSISATMSPGIRIAA
jgi:large subunit ribosomal protein L1